MKDDNLYRTLSLQIISQLGFTCYDSNQAETVPVNKTSQ